MINRFILFFLLISLISCETILSSKKDINNKNKIEVKPIDFSNIDAYPLLPECENFTSRVAQKDCFYKFLSKRIELSLSKKSIAYSTTKNDTIRVIITVSSKGIISARSTNLNNTNLDKIINEIFDNLPTIQPAIKAGIPVTSQFLLPMVVKPKKP